MSVEELLDIVDENDNVIKVVPRSQAYQQELFTSMRSVWAFVKNDKGQLWIPRRHPNKKILPNALDGSIVGHVSAGESYEQAFKREAQEELFIDIEKTGFKEIAYLTPKKDGMFCFKRVYEIHLNDIPNYNKDDFCECFWLMPHEVVEKLERGDTGKTDLKLLMQRLYINSASVAQ